MPFLSKRRKLNHTSYDEIVDVLVNVGVVAALMLSFSVALFTQTSAEDVHKRHLLQQFVFGTDRVGGGAKADSNFRKWAVAAMRKAQPGFDFEVDLGGNELLNIATLAELPPLSVWQRDGSLWPSEDFSQWGLNWDAQNMKLEAAARILLEEGFPLHVYVARQLVKGFNNFDAESIGACMANCSLLLSLCFSFVLYLSLVVSASGEDEETFKAWMYRFKWLLMTPFVFLVTGTVAFFFGFVMMQVYCNFSIAAPMKMYKIALQTFVVPICFTFIALIIMLEYLDIRRRTIYIVALSVFAFGACLTYIIPVVFAIGTMAIPILPIVWPSLKGEEDEYGESNIMVEPNTTGRVLTE